VPEGAFVNLSKCVVYLGSTSGVPVSYRDDQNRVVSVRLRFEEVSNKVPMTTFLSFIVSLSVALDFKVVKPPFFGRSRFDVNQAPSVGSL